MAFKDLTVNCRTVALIILLAGIFIFVPSLTNRASGQGDQPGEEGAENEEDQPTTFENYEVSADGLNNGIMLNEADADSSEVIGHLHSALAAEEHGEWTDALREYYIVINSPKDFLYKRSGLDEERVYIGMKEFCRQQLEAFPDDGKLAFKTQYEGTVKALYEKARDELDLDTLRMIHFNYCLSAYSGDALMLTANALYESGNFNEAFSYYNRLITKHPETHQPIAVAYGGLGMCALKIGASVLPILQDRRKELDGAPGDQKIVTPAEGGVHKEIPLREFFDGIIAKLQGMAGAAAPVAQTIDLSMFNRLQLKWKASGNLGLASYWTGELYGNKLFVDPMGSPNGIRVLDVDSGKTINVLGSTQSRKQNFSSKILPGEELISHTVSEDADNYYATILYSLKEKLIPGFGLAEHWGTRLLAYSNRTNKMIWYWTDPEEQNVAGTPVSADEDRQFMGDAYMTSAPVRYGAYLYAGAVRVAKPATLEYYVICIDAATGAMKWRTYIGGSTPPAVQHPQIQGGALPPAAGSSVSVANDTVYFTSNIGAAGAVNAVTGDVKWVAKYHKPPIFFLNNGAAPCDPLSLWHASAPLYLPTVVRKAAGGKDETISMLIVAPRDSDHLYAFDPETGKRIWDRPMRANDNVPVDPTVPPRMLMRFNGKIMILQSALDESAESRAEDAMTFLGRGKNARQENPPQPPEGEQPQPPQAQGQPALVKAEMVDIIAGTDVPFAAYLGQNAIILGKPIVFGPLVFVLTSSAYKGQTTYAIIAYDTTKNDKIVLYKEVGDLCEGKRICKMFITGDAVIFLCDGAVYVYSPAAPQAPIPAPAAAP